MSLTPGQTLAHYTILGPLGAGAMGEVWRARDTRLGREVAIKVLPPHFADDEDRLRRFEREARTLATLNHPNVAQIFGVDQVGEACFLVLELVPGESLEERLRRGPLAVPEALDVGRQVAEGLEAAHEAGVIHRDLKPANVRLTPDGKVKVLDFGLAKPAREGHEGSSTDSVLSTEAGRLLGTPTYMAPEQARGKPIDRRVDVWAFGCVLYECLTARRAFAGDTLTDVFAAVLEREPDWAALPAATPPRVRELLARCFAKDPRRRLRDVGEARVLLEDPASRSQVPPAPASRAPRWPTVALAAVVGAAAFLAGRGLRRAPSVAAPSPAPAATFRIDVPGHAIQYGSMALSPDGSKLVFLADSESGEPELWVRPLAELDSRPLPGTKGARQPFWSPDGKELAFFAGRALFRVGLGGASPRPIAEVGAAYGGSWGTDGSILYGTETGPIFRVPADGGSAPVPVTELGSEAGTAHCWPTFLPDGRHFLFLSDATSQAHHRVCIGSLDGGPLRVLRAGLRAQPLLDPRGALLLSQGGQLLAFPLDFQGVGPVSEPVLVADRVHASGALHETPVALSASGVLAYLEGATSREVQLVDPKGEFLERLAPGGDYRNPALSPDGRYLAVEMLEEWGDRGIWIFDLERDVRSLVSDHGLMADSPVWSPDGRTLFFDQDTGAGWTLRRKSLEGSAPSVDLGRPEGCEDLWTHDVTPDGRTVLVWVNIDGRGAIYLRDVEAADGGWRPWYAGSANVTYARLSRDSRWVAYTSDASGTVEVFVASFEGGPAKQALQISSGGGREPRWSPDGATLYYHSTANRLAAATITVEGDRLRAGVPEERFELMPLHASSVWRNTFDVTADGRAFVVLREPDAAPRTICVRTGWHW